MSIFTEEQRTELTEAAKSDLSPAQETALRTAAKEFIDSVAFERKRWGEESAKSLASKGVDLATYRIRFKTLHALEKKGYVRLHTRSFTSETDRRGAYGRRLGGTKTRQHVQIRVALTEKGLAWYKANKA